MTEQTAVLTPVFPWRRALARVTDYLLWGVLISAVLLSAVEHGHSELLSPAVLYVAFLLYIPTEAFLVSRNGTTPGKKILGLRVTDANGGHIPFKASLKRSFLVFAAGMGFFLPVISLVCPLYALFRLYVERIAWWDKKCGTEETAAKVPFRSVLFLAVFYLLLLGGCLMTLKTLTKIQINLDAVEENIVVSYTQEVRPILTEALSEDALLTPESVQKTADKLRRIQEIIAKYQDGYALLQGRLQKQIDAYPLGETRARYQESLNAQSDRLKLFWFVQSIRISMFENIVGFFKSAEGRYEFKDGTPVFKDPELMKQYENYMQQLNALIRNTSAAPDEASEETPEEEALQEEN